MRPFFTLCLIGVVLVSLPVSGVAQLSFHKTTVVPRMKKLGDNAVAWLDYNNDGLLDLYVAGVPEGDGGHLFRRTGQGSFEEVTDRVNLDAVAGNGAAVGDYDNDGNVDLYITGGEGENVLCRNGGETGFADETQAAGVEVAGSGLSRSSASFVDIDNDGDLDLFAGNVAGRDFLFRNNGDGSFTEMAVQAGVSEPRRTIYHMFGDIDNDGWMDLFVGNNLGYNSGFSDVRDTEFERLSDALYRNNGDGTFTNIVQQAGINHLVRPEEVLFWDYNNDGWLDIFLASVPPSNRLYRNNGDRSFTEVGEAAGVRSRGFSSSVTAGDYDNDGWLDLFVANRMRFSSTSPGANLLYRNNADGTFTEIASGSGLSGEDITSIANSGDYDNDGFLDLFLSNGDGTSDALYRNVGNANHWLHLDLVGTKSNRSAIGARIQVRAGNISMVREVNGGNGYGGETHFAEFGLGPFTQVDEIEIRWPSGQVDRLSDVPADRQIRVVEGKGVYYVIEPAALTHRLPGTVEVGQPFDASSLVVQPALFEADARITGVTLRGLGGSDLPLVDRGDGTYGVEGGRLTVTGSDGLRVIKVLIEQATSAGPYRTVLSTMLKVIEPERPTPAPTASASLVDFDADGAVAFADFLTFAKAFGSSDARFDLDEDGTVNFPDFLVFARLFGEANPSPQSVREPDPPPPPAPSLKQVLIVNTPANTRHIMLLVPEGTFDMGVEENGPGPVHTVFLDAYYIDQFEITNERFVAFLNNIGVNYLPNSNDFTPLVDIGTETEIRFKSRFEVASSNFVNRPVSEVSWRGADAYCKWMGGRLPTEAEWEKAARGTDGRLYPWGNDPLNITLSHYQADIFEEYSTVDVGSKPRGVSPYGVHDMVGNVNEWVSDWWHSEYYNVSPRENPKGPTNGVFHTYRGGSTVSRDGLWRHPVGFRCVRDPKP